MNEQILIDWATANNVCVGVAKIALGVYLVHHTWTSGVIQSGIEIIQNKVPFFNEGTATGAMVGAGIGVLAGKIIGGAGIVAMGSGIGIPAGLVMLGMAAVFSAGGYVVGDVAMKFQHSVVPEYLQMAAELSLGAYGLFLIIQGSLQIKRAIAPDYQMPDEIAKIYDTVARQIGVCVKIVKDNGNVIALSMTGGYLAMIGAPSLVTVAGSSTLGSIGVGLGILAVPMWPVYAGVLGAGGLALAWNKRDIIKTQIRRQIKRLD